MCDLKVGDIVARKSYGGDIPFIVCDIVQRGGKTVYVLKGMLYRIVADSYIDDLVKPDPKNTRSKVQNDILNAKRQAVRTMSRSRLPLLLRLRSRPGKVLHIDGDRDFLERCLEFYRENNVKAVGVAIDEKDQPAAVRQLLERNKPSVLVITGHDSIKKNSDKYSLSSYKHSRYFIESVKEARKYEQSRDKLCIFAGACQSYYEGIMNAGANFASSPGRILINALDPSFVSEKVATTEKRSLVTPEDIAKITISGKEGIWGVSSRGQLTIL